jgi:OOP family OmpA-OmpF porin
MRNVKLGVVLLSLLAVAAGPAAAQSKDDDSGLYLGASGGLTHWTKSCYKSTVPCDDKDVGYRVFGGYRFNRWWSAEMAYFDLGASEGSIDLGGGQIGTFKHGSYGADVAAVGSVPLVGNLSAFGKLGIYLARTTLKQENGGVVIRSSGTTNHNYMVGAGLQYTLGFLGIQLGWQRYNNLGTEGTTIVEDDTDYYSLGILIRF